ncbi:hypothetical protein JG687_00016648 [Phytophthora cactorum]|uniref:Uncharacterized protein n=1 Tax=Phytophthora cactorum TaxID=29920 RepID=A0A8T1TQ65_9STRA|nr:hypothetical protein PC123_g24111 [Phytophthora cactorum]KAG6946524.1 hypothetical protein JG687_00016648 [Phytophthora cactorum]
MTSGINPEVEGVTTFALCPDGSFRYRISLKNEQVNLWLEDRTSKKQWQSGLLTKEDYVTAANTFVDASAADYVSCFQQCLDCSLDNSNESQRKLVSLKNGRLQLEMSIKLRLLRSVREVKYIFKLEPVAVDKIDILESKLKDQQEELDKFRGLGERAFLHAESVTWNSSKLQWKPIDSTNFVLASEKTSIMVRVPGLYTIAVLVNHGPLQNVVGAISLEKNGAVILSAATGAVYSGYHGNHLSHQTSSSLTCIVQIKKDESIAVVCTGTSAIANTASYLTAVGMGN